MAGVVSKHSRLRAIFPLLLPPDSPDSFVAFPCELEPQNRRKMPRRGRGKKRKEEKKEEKEGLILQWIFLAPVDRDLDSGLSI